MLVVQVHRSVVTTVLYLSSDGEWKEENLCCDRIVFELKQSGTVLLV
jgi:hypothetical protein